ncbi:MAG: heavy metal-associated domain-containing protein [Pseudomonadales bacterium]|nr:heavy metal-associated domain-containing protein [Pseudomonadales bacterium]
MKKYYFCSLLLSISMVSTANHCHEHHQNIDKNQFDVSDQLSYESGSISTMELVSNDYNFFTNGLSNSQIAVVKVKGMVCDFCARGIEKTFSKDKNVKKIDVDLSKGRVMIAYAENVDINFDDIKTKILSNGQTAVEIQLIKI